MRMLAPRLLAVVGSALLLTGCLPEPTPLPERHGSEELVAEIKSNMSHYLMPGSAAPDVEFERFVEADELQSVWQECFDELGANVTVGTDSSISWHARSDDAEQDVELAMYTCHVRFPHAAWADWLMSDEERSFLYDYSVGVVAPCLRSAGYHVTAHPEKGSYLAGTTYWEPYEAVWERLGFDPAARSPHLKYVEARCPAVPPGWYER